MSPAARRNLVFARVGDHSLHKNFLADPYRERNWDLQLSAFGKDEERVLHDGDLTLSIDHGTKWDSVLRYFTADPDLLEKYDYVMFPDDDLLFESSMSLDRFFDVCHEFDLFLAQPACAPVNYASSFQVCCPAFRLRFTNFVECMAPCIKTSYLKSAILPLYKKWITGWGTDLIWALLMPDPAFKTAIIDEVTMIHTRRHQTGVIYNAYRNSKVDPQREIAEVRANYPNTPSVPLVYGGVLKNGRRVGGPLASTINALHHLRNARMRTGIATLIRSATLANYRPVQLLPIEVETQKNLIDCEVTAN